MARRRWKTEDIKSVVEGQNPFTQFGYSVPEAQHKKGDEWTDPRGITWEQKDGYRVRVNKSMQSVRHLLKQQCSKCHKDINLVGNRFDKKLHPKTGMCHDCLVDYETELMLTGKFQSYEQRKVLSNQLTFLKHVKDQVEESVKYLESNQKITFVNEFGDVESWTNDARDTMLDGAKSDLDRIVKDIQETETLLSTIKD
jgi:ligand-binding sensor protein